MIKFKDYKEAKRNFKATMNKDVNGTMTIQFVPNEGYLRIAAHDRFNNLREIRLSIESELGISPKKVTVSSVVKDDCLWDIIWDKNGFYYETYAKAYSSIETRSTEHGTMYDICQVVFHSKKRRYVYTSLQCESIKVIE